MILTKTVTLRGKIVSVCDLKPNCRAKVDVLCPVCNQTRTVFYRSIAKAGHCVCQKCMVIQTKAVYLGVGDKYGMLTILDRGKNSGVSICQCDCGTIREFDNWNLKSGKTQSCGCLKSLNFINSPNCHGEQHWNWKGGISAERSRSSVSSEYKAWRRTVFHRDGFKCVKCGSTDRLQAHHIIPYDGNKALSMEITNGATLCVKCHRDFHKKFGRRNITKQHFAQYIMEDNLCIATATNFRQS